MDKVRDDRLIEQYLQGRLTPDEQKAFDEKMKDPAFREEVQFRSGIQQVIRKDMGKSELSSLIQKVTAETPQPVPAYSGWIRILVPIAALVAISTGFIAYAYINYSKPAIAERHFIDPQLSRVIAGAADNNAVLHAMQLSLYNQEYQQVLDQQKKLTAPTPAEQAEANYLAFVANFYLRRYPPVDRLEELIKQHDLISSEANLRQLKWNKIMLLYATDQPVARELALGEFRETTYLKAFQEDSNSFWRRFLDLF